MTTPKFSIVTPSYNQSSFLKRSLESVQAQTYRTFQHLIHDGLSTDNSQIILKHHAARYSNVSLVIQKDDGQVEAINNGLGRASGDILTWLNSDDFYFDENTLAIVADEFQDDSVDVLYGRGWYVDEDGKRLRDVYVNRTVHCANDLVDKIGLFQPALFFRKRVFEKVGLLDRRYQLTLDYDYWIRILNSGARFKFLDRPLAKATLHNDSKTCHLRTRQLVETIFLTKDRFGYVHPNWLNHLREHAVNNNDWTTAHHQTERVAAPVTIPALRTDNPLTHFSFEHALRLGRTAPIDRFAQTAPPRPAIIATTFNSDYFVQGLNLIASIHRQCRHSIDAVVVYDLGLTPTQLSILTHLQGVIVQPYPSEAPWDGYYNPKSYIYKCFAISDAQRFLNCGNGIVLWIDAGVCVTGSLDEIFDIVQNTGVFFIDHDDRHNNSLVNGALTHPKQVMELSLTPAVLGQCHVCSCVIGYLRNSVGERVVEHAHRLSLQQGLNDYTKHPKMKWNNTLLREREHERRLQLLDRNAGKYLPLAELAGYPYFGHRQDQSLYSNLAAMMGLKVRSASRYCPATDNSSKVSLENWKSGGEHAEIVRSGKLPEGFSSPLFHHRGTYTNLCGLITTTDNLVSSRIGIVLGNGPSLKQIPFTEIKGVATVGMNAAYRYWEVHGWYPTYYCCMDTTVIRSHATAIKRLIEESSTNCIQLFFLRRTILDTYPELQSSRNVIFLEDVRPLCTLFQIEPITTGSYSLLLLAFLGFREIYLAGVDCNYVERVSEAIDGNAKNKLVIDRPIKNNPNYFFDDYQQKGDEFNLPNPSKDLHVRSWRNADAAIRNKEPELGRVTITNLNEKSRVDCFVNASWDVFISDIFESSIAIAQELICDLDISLEVRERLAYELGGAIASTISGCADTRIPSHVATQPRYANLKFVRTVTETAGMEFRLTDPVEVSEHEIMTMAVILSGLPSPLHVALLDEEGRLTSPHVDVVRWGGAEVVLSRKPQAIYAVEIGNDTALLLVCAEAKVPAKFVGLRLTCSDAASLGLVTSVECVGLSIFRPAIEDVSGALDHDGSKTPNVAQSDEGVIGHVSVVGPFDRKDKAHYDETDCIATLFSGSLSGSTMIDVGAHFGTSLAHFLEKGWQIFAFEPDSKNRAKLLERLTKHPNSGLVTLDTRAVGNKSQKGLSFYTSEISTGISSLSAFHESHHESQHVDVVTLKEFLRSRALSEVDFLKIDTEGHDLFVLQGFPWGRFRPQVIECEFEDKKTIKLGYTFHDLADYLLKKGYTVYVSEWHPIVRYGIRHDWRRLIRYPCDLADPDGWGNLLAFHEPIDEGSLRAAVEKVLSVAHPVSSEPLPDAHLAPVTAHSSTKAPSAPRFRVAPSRYFDRLTADTWRYSRAAAGDQALWVAIFREVGATIGRTFAAGMRIRSNKNLALGVSIARNGTSEYEGTLQKVTLVAGIDQHVDLHKTFKAQHTYLKLQIEVLGCPDGDTAELVLDSVYLLEVPRGVGAHLQAGELTLSVANRMFRQGNYADALTIYLRLNELRPLPMYVQNAQMAGRKLGLNSLGVLNGLV